MAISDPITENPVITKYRQFVTDKINNQIVYGDDNLPKQSMSSFFNGTTAGIVSNPDLFDGPINAANIFAILLDDVNKYTRIRRFNANITVTGASPNGNDKIPALNTSANEAANLEREFACEWVTTVNSGIETVPIGTQGPWDSKSWANNFFAKYNTLGIQDYNAIQVVVDSTGKFISAVAHTDVENSCKQATQKYAATLKIPAGVERAKTYNDIGILTAKHSFKIDSADVDHSMIVKGDVMDDADFEQLFNNLYIAWETVALSASAINYREVVCHANCHNSCHSSRNRR